MDRLKLRGIECHCHIGVPEDERVDLQPILIDLDLEADLADAGWNDDEHLAPDYWAVEKAVRALAEKGRRKLIEALAEETAELVLKTQARVEAVTVRVTKKPAAMPKTREVVVEIRRERAPAPVFEPDRS